MKKLLSIFVLVTVLSGCVMSEKNRIITVSIACDAYATTLGTLTELFSRNALTPRDVQTINEVIEVVSPICLGDIVDATPIDIIDIIQKSILRLIDIKRDRL